MKLKIRKDLKDKEDLNLADMLIYLDSFFNSDYDKMKTWLIKPNPDLGNSSPLSYISSGNIKTVTELLKLKIKKVSQ